MAVDIEDVDLDIAELVEVLLVADERDAGAVMDEPHEAERRNVLSVDEAVPEVTASRFFKETAIVGLAMKHLGTLDIANEHGVDGMLLLVLALAAHDQFGQQIVVIAEIKLQR